MAKGLLDKRLSDNNTKPLKPNKIASPKPVKTKNLLSSRISAANDNEKAKEYKEETFKVSDRLSTKINEAKKEKVSFIEKIKPEKKIKPDFSKMDIDTALNTELNIKEKKEISKVKTDERKRLFKKIGILAGCIYIILLIFGVVITDYTYDESGNPMALAMSFSDLKHLDDFSKLTEQYYEMQDLYAKMLDIDYKFYSNPADVIALSAEYEGLLEDVSKVSIQTEALSVSTAYTQIKAIMLSWVKSDIAVYLQNMSAAISLNDNVKANNAAKDRTRLQNNYTNITNNLIAIGKKIKGMDVNKLIEWTPENHNEKLAR